MNKWILLMGAFMVMKLAHAKVVLPFTAASGVVEMNGKYLLISDTDAVLYEVDKAGKLVNAYTVPWEELSDDPVTRKKKKPDFESLTFLPKHDGVGFQGLLLLPSFSKPNRVRAAYFKINKSSEIVTPPEMIDLTELEPKLKMHAAELNIEGVSFVGKKLSLFQRGNGKNNFNGVFEITVSAGDLITGSKIGKWPVKFKKIKLEKGFSITDALDLGSVGIVLSACIEETENTYDDGKILGSGLFLYKNGKTKKLKQFDGDLKIEGVTGTYNKKAKKLSLVMVDDPDDHRKKSFFLEMEIAL
ncbi:MAG: hypothetical protein KA715_13530 [Xanthomonadaceae bacterium]|nr:hypothetical protein [Xanthomonadaceae bacterium]